MAYTDMERRILDMWPKFEDGSYVRLGDSYIDKDGDDNKVMAIEFNYSCTNLAGVEGFCTRLSPSERVKRPAPKVRIEMVSPGEWECSGCGGLIDWDSYDDDDPPNCNYCPNCGAKVVDV